MKASRTTFFLVHTSDRPGEASNLLNTLGQNRIDLEAMWGYGTPDGTADIFLVPRDQSLFESTAGRLGIEAIKGTCFRLSGPDEIGSLTSTLSSIARQDINISAVNATAINGEVGGFIWSKPEDVEKIAKALNV